MSPHETLVALAEARAAGRDEPDAFVFLADGERESEQMGFPALAGAARAIASSLSTVGAAGDRVVLLFPPGLGYIRAFFGCLYAGMIAVPAYPPKNPRHMDRLAVILRHSTPAAVLTSGDQRERLGAWLGRYPDLATLPVLSAEELEEAGSADRALPALSARSPAFLQYTSGSTSTPKGVVIPHGALLHNEEMIRRAFGQTADSVIVSWLPLYHDMGLIGGMLQPLYVGARCILMPPVAFLQRPACWLRAISRYRATTSGGPNFAYDLAARRIDPQAEGLELGSWSVAFNGSEPVRADTLDRFAARFASAGFRRDAFFPCYGLAEATLFVTGVGRGAGATVRTLDAAALEQHRVEEPRQGAGAAGQRLVGSGSPWLGQRVLIVDPQSRAALPPGSVGEIWIQGPSVAAGYWGQPDASREVFAAELAAGDGPFLRTGDLGFVEGDELFITGRRKELIIVRGRNLYPQDIEASVDGVHAALRPGCCAAFGAELAGEERLIVVAEARLRSGMDPLEALNAVRGVVADDHQVAPYEVVLIRAATLPKTSSGKIRRLECRRLYLEDGLQVEARSGPGSSLDEAERPADPHDELAELAGVDEAGRRPALVAYLRRELERRLGARLDAADARRPLTALGLDSLAATDLVHHLEAGLGVEASVSALLRGASLEELTEDLLRSWGPSPLAPAPAPPPRPGGAGEGALSPGERSLWFVDRLGGESAVLNLGGVAALRSGVGGEELREALARVAARHPALATGFFEEGGELTDRVVDDAGPEVAETDAGEWSAARLEAALAAEIGRPFDLGRPPLLRLRLWSVAPGVRLLSWVAHHLIADFWSLVLLVRDLDAALAGRELGPAVARSPGPPADRASDEALLAYWGTRLEGAPPVLELPTDRPRPRRPTYEGISETLTLDRGTAAAARAFSRRHGVTLSSTLLAAYAVLLARTARQSDFVLGVPTVQRRAGQAEEVGYRVEPVPFRCRPQPREAFAHWARRAHGELLDDADHRGLGVARIAEHLELDRDPSRAPLFQSMFVFLRSHLEALAPLPAFALGHPGVRLELDRLRLESRRFDLLRAQVDWMLSAGDLGEQLVLALTVSAPLFERTTAVRTLRRLEALLRAGLEDGDEVGLGELPWLSRSERHQLVVEWNAGVAPPVARGSLHQTFATQAAAHPERVAVTDGEARLTYRELARRAAAVAARLADAGVGVEDRVAVLLDRSADLVAALLGVLRAGAAYVPLDPAYPAERLAFMVEDSQAAVVLRGPAGPELPAGTAVIVESPVPESRGRDLPPPRVEPSNLAYVIYTSGSTGRPKGVAIEHGSALSLIEWSRELFPDASLEGVVAATSVCFDLSVFELFVPLCRGGSVLLVEGALALPSLASRRGVRLINTVPSAMAELVRLGDLPAGTRIVNLAGEPLRGSLVRRIGSELPAARVFNLYGPSEHTTYATAVEAATTGEGEPTVGRPIEGTAAYLLDGRLRAVPIGVPGEICLGGAGLCRGYLGRPALTASRFVPDPTGGRAGERLYRTGDLGRLEATGEIQFLGRLDHQVKLRGFRIELGEIEAAIARFPGVSETVVVVTRSPAGDPHLVAYVGGVGLGAADEAALRESLGSHLPSFMIPSRLVILENLPHLPNGKIDRAALPGLDEGPPAVGLYEPPANAIEEIVAEIWSEVLGRERIGRHDDFFRLGGHSLLATRIVSEIRERLAVELPLHRVFSRPTVAQLAETVADELAAAFPGDEEMTAVTAES